MQRKLLESPIYRSLADRTLIVSENQSVVTVRANHKAPYRATLFVERVLDERVSSERKKSYYDVRQVAYYSEVEYGDPNTYKYRFTIYGVFGPGIHHSSISHDAFDIENFSCFVKSISNETAKKLLSQVSQHQDKYSQNPADYLGKSSLDFFQDVLKEVKILTDESLVLIQIPPRKEYPLKALTLWQKNDQRTRSPIDQKRESDFSAKILPLPSNPLPLTLEMRLQCFFKGYIEKTHVIDWKSEEGQNIRFLQNYFGLLAFSYNTTLPHYLEKTLMIPSVLLKIIVEYAAEHNAKFAYDDFFDLAPKKFCSIL